MQYVLTASQMKRADKRMIEEVGIPSMVLMERAALQTVEVLKEEGVDLKKVLVVCGSGNNGGDGFAIGRLLMEEGYDPDIVFVGSMDSRSTETRQQMQILEKMNIKIGNSLPEKEYTAIVDAVFGIGLSREIEGRYRTVIERMNAYSGRKIAVDIASGISADSGKILGCAFRADITVTFAYSKIGQILYPGAEYSGRVYVRNIGIHNPELESQKELYVAFEQEDLQERLPSRRPDSNKGTYGKVLCITGSRGMSGAAYLSAKAAYLTGAGLVRIYTEESNRQIIQQLLPEAIVTTYREEEEHPFSSLHEMMDWADVICMGCGLGMSPHSRNLVEEVLSYNTKPCVIDADGLNIIAEFSAEQQKKLLKEEGLYIFTPHMKEMSRLSGCTVSEMKEDRLSAAKAFLQQFPVTCVLKDSRTLVVEEKEKYYINTSGNAAMAKAGSGDVLAGMITGLLAQKMATYEAAVLGVYLHGLAGDEARSTHGSYSVLAEDILSGISKVLREIN